MMTREEIAPLEQMADSLTTEDIRRGIARWPDGRYRISVHPDSEVGRAVRAGMSQAEIKERFGVELVGDAEIVTAAGTYRVRPAEAMSIGPIQEFLQGSQPERAELSEPG